MYYQSSKIFFSVLRVFFFRTSTIFEASPFHFSVLQTLFSQLACSHQYSFPVFPEVCGLTLEKNKANIKNHWTNNWGKYTYSQRNNFEIRLLKLQKF